jgi:hypothetical protein
MPENEENVEKCKTIDSLAWTGAGACPFLRVLCDGNQGLDNCLQADSIEHGQTLANRGTWAEADEPYAY